MGKRRWPAKRDRGRRCRHLGKWAGIFPYEHSVPPTGMKNVEMRMRRRNYVFLIKKSKHINQCQISSQ